MNSVTDSQVLKTSKQKENFFVKIWIFTMMFFGVLVVGILISNKLAQKVLVVNSDGSILYSEAVPIEIAEKLHKKCARDAAEALLMRNPKGLDNFDLFEAMYRGEAKEEALKEISLNRSSYAEKKIHQKLEISDTEYSKRDDGIITITFIGQVILNGVTKSQHTSKPFQYAKPYELILDLARNPSVGSDLYTPYVILSYALTFTKNNRKEDRQEK
jgi:hypothetical protein